MSAPDPRRDRLYALLPSVHRRRDAVLGEPLRALLQVIAQQVNVVEDDILQLYDDWFVETAADWALPYLGELIGYRPVADPGPDLDPSDPRAAALLRVLAPRREIANTVAYRRRKGTLTLLEQLARDVAGCPGRAVAFGPSTTSSQHLASLRPERGRGPDLRRGEALELVGGPFDPHAHAPDLRRVSSLRRRGLHHPQHVGVFVWRLRPFRVDGTPAYCLESAGLRCYTFSVLGNDVPLWQPGRSAAELGDPPRPVAPIDLPLAITRRAFELREPGPEGVARRANPDQYGPAIAVWATDWPRRGAPQPIPIERIVPADLSDWRYDPPAGSLALDPELGRLAFPSKQLPPRGVRTRYHYAAPAAIGGGSYPRGPATPADAAVYVVRSDPRAGEHPTVAAALAAWRGADPRPRDAVIEIADSGVYTEAIALEPGPGESVQLRAADGVRPVLRLLDYLTDRPDPFVIRGGPGARVTLDGLLIGGRGLRITPLERAPDPDEPDSGAPDTHDPEGGDPDSARLEDLCEVRIRHCTLVPGWTLDPRCEPRRPFEASIVLADSRARLRIEASIVGSIEIAGDPATHEPVAVTIVGSILDATDAAIPALAGPGGRRAWASLDLVRSTVFGELSLHRAERIDTSIVTGLVDVARRRRGCVRYSSLPAGSRTPRRYRCQPDLAEAEARAALPAGASAALLERRLEEARLRVAPRFESRRYGTPRYARLAAHCPPAIREGAEDGSEMGVHHDLYEPQRWAALETRLRESTPAGFEVGVVAAD